MNGSVEGGQQGFTGSGHRKTSGKNGVAVYTGGPDELFGSGKYAVRSSLKMASSPSIRSLHDHSGRTVTNDSLVPIPLMPSAAHGAVYRGKRWRRDEAPCFASAESGPRYERGALNWGEMGAGLFLENR